MPSMDRIYVENLLVGILVDDVLSSSKESCHFVSDENLSLQVGLMNRKEGTSIPAHHHNPQERLICDTQEVIYILKGRVRVDFYNEEGEISTTLILKAGDLLQLIAGKHGFEIIDDAVFFEIKQGPYVQSLDKSLI
jgi:cupin fold WbuC family metalloprotein